MEIGLYSFGDTPSPAGEGEPTAVAMRNLLEAICLADEVGLDYFGVGEHHTDWAPVSAAPVLLSAAAAKTKNIRLGSAVTVLSTEDPVRLYQQFSTLDAIASGRAELIAGRGSSTESFPLFGYDLRDYDALFAEKLDLLLRLNLNDIVDWEGAFRAPLHRARIVPRPHAGQLDIWLGTGGSAASSVRAGQLGLPISYGVIGGPVGRFAPVIDLYRGAAKAAGHATGRLRVAIASPGFIGKDGVAARDLWWRHWCALMQDVATGRRFPPPDKARFDIDCSAGGALFVGTPEEVAERIVRLHQQVGHDRHFFQMDIGHLPQHDYLRAIELLGTRVKPLVDAELGHASATMSKPPTYSTTIGQELT